MTKHTTFFVIALLLFVSLAEAARHAPADPRRTQQESRGLQPSINHSHPLLKRLHLHGNGCASIKFGPSADGEEIVEQQLIVDATHGWATKPSRRAGARSRIFVEHARQQSIFSKLALEEDMPVVVSEQKHKLVLPSPPENELYSNLTCSSDISKRLFPYTHEYYTRVIPSVDRVDMTASRDRASRGIHSPRRFDT
ncbi:hypothetical protein B296_00058782 [Ensete ventricosum]|uniref:Neprosin activation peptide domain-containing protein n=1 Tax=Ensete ventricosum TaxID=4639 RepID=A0A426X829_ENSVE|nr:hypothetical protein B296_00058782 [Ensete ventricosum]